MSDLWSRNHTSPIDFYGSGIACLNAVIRDFSEKGERDSGL